MANPLLIVAAIAGTAFYLPQGPVRIGHKLGINSTVYTWRNSGITYKTPFTGIMQQYACTVMAVDRMRYVKGALDMSVRIRKPLGCGGNPLVLVQSKFTNKDSRLALKSPAGLEARLKGTTIGFSLDEKDRAIVGVQEGMVEACSPKNTVTIPAGYFAQEKADGTWSNAQKIPTPDIQVKTRVGNLALLRVRGIKLLDATNYEIILDNGYAWVETPKKLTVVDIAGRSLTLTIPLVRK